MHIFELTMLFSHCTYTALLWNLKTRASALSSAVGFVDDSIMNRFFGLHCMILQAFVLKRTDISL